MSVWDWLLLIAVALAVVFAIRGMRKQRGCCGNCSACTGCPSKAREYHKENDQRRERANDRA